jgi:hypothetical protein
MGDGFKTMRDAGKAGKGADRQDRAHYERRDRKSATDKAERERAAQAGAKVGKRVQELITRAVADAPERQGDS